MWSDGFDCTLRQHCGAASPSVQRGGPKHQSCQLGRGRQRKCKPQRFRLRRGCASHIRRCFGQARCLELGQCSGKFVTGCRIRERCVAPDDRADRK
ncbi:MAG TPA: hypothetical protein VK457_10025 [Chloroflexota bacterium]|nr:hypothetical protein [Chloroflexota bacterium]